MAQARAENGAGGGQGVVVEDGVRSVRAEELGDEALEACAALWASVFAKPGRTAETVAEDMRRELATHPGRDERWHFVWQQAPVRRVVAAARTFTRTVGVGDGTERAVLALAHVASHADARGLGLASRVLGVAFTRVAGVGEPGPQAALFQTGVPRFYTKLGGAELACEVGNSTGEGHDEKRRRGFWEPHVMVFPAAAAEAWPDGPIDLRGTGY